MTAPGSPSHCPVCTADLGKRGFRSMMYPRRSGAGDGGPESIAFCSRCGLGVAYPVPSAEEMEYLYASGTYWENRPVARNSRRQFPVPFALAEARWALLEPMLRGSAKPLTILDMGAGHGFMGMVAARSRTVDLVEYAAVEKDRSMTESLRNTWKDDHPDVRLQAVGTLTEVTGLFRCAVLSHILEHVIDPKGLLLEVMDRLEPGGILFVDVPNQDHLFKEDVFPHLLFFNPNAIRYLLEICGLRITLVETFGKDMVRPTFLGSDSRFPSVALRLVTAAGSLLPAEVTLAFFSRHLGMKERNPNGTWIRAAAVCSKV